VCVCVCVHLFNHSQIWHTSFCGEYAGSVLRYVCCKRARCVAEADWYVGISPRQRYVDTLQKDE
jgi:hypothetical protein